MNLAADDLLAPLATLRRRDHVGDRHEPSCAHQREVDLAAALLRGRRRGKRKVEEEVEDTEDEEEEEEEEEGDEEGRFGTVAIVLGALILGGLAFYLALILMHKAPRFW